MTKHKPETPLPWNDIPEGKSPPRNLAALDDVDHDYIVHACNAYPKLVAYLKEQAEKCKGGYYENWVWIRHTELLKELGEL
jgi:hypothetical protein